MKRSFDYWIRFSIKLKIGNRNKDFIHIIIINDCTMHLHNRAVCRAHKFNGIDCLLRQHNVAYCIYLTPAITINASSLSPQKLMRIRRRCDGDDAMIMMKDNT